MSIKFEDLKPGMLTNAGLIIRRGEAGSDKFFGDKKHIRFFDPREGFYGQHSRSVDDDESFSILHDVGTGEYNAVLQKIIEERIQCKCDADADADIDLLRAYKR
jgi:hypothetical protein